jgi:repressor LexA
VREVAAHFGIQPRAAADHLAACKRKGYLHRAPGRSRGLTLFPRTPGQVVEVPILGRIAAGQPLLAAENVEDTLPLPRSWVRGEETFLLRVTGESMAPLIRPGDLVMVRVQSRVARGEIAVVLVDDEATLKRVFEEAGGLVLRGDNPDFIPLRFSPEEAADLQILGKVVGVYRSLER